MSELRLIVFDWDGTLMDSEAAIVATMTEAYQYEQITAPHYDAIRAIIGLSLSDAISGLTPALQAAQIDRVTANYRRIYSSRSSVPALFPQVRAILVELKRSGYALAVATGKGRAGLAQALDDSGLNGLFITTCTAEQSEPKPSPAMLLDILAELDIVPGAALMIGDTEFDLAMAQAAKVHLAAVSYGAHPVSRLRPYNPVFMLDSFAELPGQLLHFRGPGHATIE